jgi:hypothetical protein
MDAVNAPNLLRARNLLTRGMRDQFVYFILVEAPRVSAVKIGWSFDPQGRIPAIRRGGCKTPSHVENYLHNATVIGQVIGDKELETELHRVFADARLSGEWFDYGVIAPDVTRILAEHCVCRGCQVMRP